MLTINTKIKENSKFTTASIGCFLRMPLTRHNLAFASLLARMQMNASLYFPTIKEQQEKLAQLYDLQFEVFPQLFGKELILSYLANFVEPSTLLDPEYTYAQIVETLASIIQYPSFNSELISLSKKQLLTDYRELMEEPSNIALDHFFRIWYQRQPDYAENFMGPIDEIKVATPEEVKIFSDSLKTVPTCVIAEVKDAKSLKRLINQEFKQAGILKKFIVDQLTIPAPKLAIEKNELKSNLQAQLMIGYGYKEDLNYKQQVAGMVLAQYLAGDPSSKLFTQIREELGAAYAVEANNYANNSLFLISAGVDPKKAKVAKEIIKHAIQEVVAGEIDKDILQKAKKALLTSQLIGSDQLNWQMAQELRKALFSGYADFDRNEAIKKVTKTQLKNFAKNLFFNESYVLQ